MILYLNPAISYFVLGVIDIEHIGPSFPGPDRLHRLWHGLWASSFQGVYGGAMICESAPDAESLITYLVQFPHIIEDCCSICHDAYPHPHRPRWNLNIPQDKSNLTPAIIENWWESI